MGRRGRIPEGGSGQGPFQHRWQEEEGRAPPVPSCIGVPLVTTCSPTQLQQGCAGLERSVGTQARVRSPSCPSAFL